MVTDATPAANGVKFQTDSRLSSWILSYLGRCLIGGIWISSFVSVISLVAWMLLDPLFKDAFRWLQLDVASWFQANEDSFVPIHRRDEVGSRIGTLKATLAILIGTQAVILLLLFCGPRFHRKMIGFLGCVTLVAISAGVLNAWQDIVWQGARWRLQNQLGTVEPVANDLRQNWPQVDGRHAEFGPFSAYPYGQASVLTLLAMPERTPGNIQFSAVERSSSGGLRFQLAGVERGYWLEWHPQNEQPSSFEGGLQENYRLVRSASLNEGWHLATYEVGRKKRP